MVRNVLARAGYIAIGIIYAAVGVVTARVAFLGARDRIAGLPGALRYLLQQPHGVALLWAVVAGVASFSVWRFLEASRRRRYGLLDRVGLALSGVGYSLLAWTGVSLLLRLRAERRGALRRAALEWLLSQRWGPGALIAVGAGVIASAVYQLYQAWSGRLRDRFATRWMGRWAGKLAVRVARVGIASRAAVFGIVGFFLIRAGRERDPKQFHEIGGALRLLGSTALGPWVMGAVALGLVAFALYMLMLALFRRGS